MIESASLENVLSIMLMKSHPYHRNLKPIHCIIDINGFLRVVLVEMRKCAKFAVRKETLKPNNQK